MAMSALRVFISFFFQAEDGIRAGHVTGVQTCALPIYVGSIPGAEQAAAQGALHGLDHEIGRASCRERGYFMRCGGGAAKRIVSSHRRNRGLSVCGWQGSRWCIGWSSLWVSG